MSEKTGATRLSTNSERVLEGALSSGQRSASAEKHQFSTMSGGSTNQAASHLRLGPARVGVLVESRGSRRPETPGARFSTRFRATLGTGDDCLTRVETSVFN